MANEIDNRIVSLSFDNKNFEKNVKESMGTISTLDKALEFKGAGDGFKNLEKAASTIDFSGIQNSIANIEKAFTPLGIAFRKVWTDVISEVEAKLNQFNALVFKNPYKDGFQEYELKMGSVQTIMNATGESLETVMDYLEELNTYSDRTIYSFKDMTSNIGKFTNAGVSLKDAVTAIQGISNEAALSGASAEEASRAMYNFSQALASGYVKLIDWKSIELANMATIDFKNQLLQTAEALGTVVRIDDKFQSVTTDLNGNVSDLFDAQLNFNDSLSSQWLTTDVLTKTLARYTDETTELGKKSFAAAEDIKTFSMLMDTLKEAMGSGWATTFELIIGNFNKAKDMFTKIGGVLGDIISKTSLVRNNIIRVWDAAGGRQKVLDKLYAGLDSLTSKYDSFLKLILGDHYDKLTGDIDSVTESVNGLTDAEKEFAWEVWNSEKYGAGDERKKAAEELGLSYENIQGYINEIVNGSVTWASYQDEVNAKLNGAKETVEETKSTVEDISNGRFSKFLQDTWQIAKNIGKTFANIVISAKNVIAIFLKSFLKNFDYDRVSGGFLEISEGVLAVSEKLKSWTEDGKTIESIFDIFFAGLNKVVDGVGIVYGIVKKPIQYLWSSLPVVFGYISKIIDKIKNSEKVQAFWDGVKKLFSDIKDECLLIKDYLEIAFESSSLKKAADGFDKIREAAGKLLTGALEGLKNLFSDTDDGASEVGDTVGKSADDISSGAKALQTLKDVLSAVFEFGKKVVNVVGPVFVAILDRIGKRLEEIKIEDILNIIKQGGIIALLFKLKGAVESFTDIGEGAGKFLSSIGDAIKASFGVDEASKIQKIAIAIAILSASLFTLALIDPDRLQFVFNRLTIWLAMIMALIAWVTYNTGNKETLSGFDTFNEAFGGFLKTLGKSTSLVGISAILLSVSSTLLSLATSIKILSTLDFNGFSKKFWVLITLLAAITTAIGVLMGIAKGAKNGFKSYFGMSKVITSISTAIKSIAMTLLMLAVYMDKSEDGVSALAKAEIILATIAAFFAIMMSVTSKLPKGTLSKSVGQFFTKFASSIIVIAIALKVLAKEDFIKIFGVASALTLMVVSIIEVMNRMFKIQDSYKKMLVFASVLKSFSVQIISVAATLKVLSRIKFGSLAAATISLIAVMAALTGMFAVFSKIENISDVGVVFLSAAAGILLIADALNVLSNAYVASDGDGLLSAVGAIAIIMLELMALMVIVKNLNIGVENIPGLLGISAAVMIMAGALALLSNSDPDDIRSIALSLGMFATAMVLVIAALSAVAPMVDAIALGILMIGIAMFAMGAAFTAGALSVWLLVKAFGEFVDVLPKFLENADKVEQGAIRFVEMLENLKTAFAQLAQEYVISMLDGLIEYVPQLVARIGTLIISVVSALEEWIPPVAKMLTRGILSILVQLSQNIADDAGMFWDAISSVGDALAVLALEKIRKIVEEFNFKGIFDGVIEDLQDSEDELKSEIETTNSALTAAFEQAKNETKELTDGVFDDIDDSAKSAIDWKAALGLDDTGGLFGVDTEEFANKLSPDDIAENMDLSKLMNGLDTSDFSKLLPKDEFTESVSEFTTDETYSDMFNAMGTNNIGAYSNPILNFDSEATWYELGENGVDGLASVLPDLDSVATQNAETLADKYQATSPQTYYEGRLMSQDGANGISSAASYYETAADTVVTKFCFKLGTLANMVREHGEMLASALVGGFDVYMAIKSPSRLMEEKAQYIGEGLTNGIKSIASSIGRVAKSLGKTTADSINGPLQNINDILSGDYVADLSVRPVAIDNVDISNTPNMGVGLSMDASAKLDSLYAADNAVAQMVNDRADTANQIGTLSNKLSDISRKLNNMQIVLDSGVLVGSMAPAMNEELGTLSAHSNVSSRGMVYARRM